MAITARRKPVKTAPVAATDRKARVAMHPPATAIDSVSRFRIDRLLSRTDPKVDPTGACTFWLRRDIVRGAFPPASRLSVDKLAVFYRVGSSPTREAVILLTSSGLVVHEHQKGHRVAPTSEADFREVFDIYRRLYRMALTMALEHGDDDWEERVVLALHRAQKISNVDLPPLEAEELWLRTFRQLHHQVLSGCGASTLLRIIADVSNRFERYLNIYVPDRARIDNHGDENQAIVQAVIRRDMAGLEEVVDRFFAAGAPVRDQVIAAITAT